MAEKKGEGEEESYSKPVKEYKLIYQIYSQSIEEVYFWFIGWFKDNLKDVIAKKNGIEKISDVSSSTELSSFFGAQSQRLGIQQDRVSTYLRTISEMISKGVFQIVRELRNIDMRLELYNKSMDGKNPDCDSNEVALKSLYVDLVEGGAQNASSVYGLAQRVGFTILPDLFFRIRFDMDPKTGDIKKSIDDTIRAMEFNDKVKELLARKLQQYYIWKKHSYKELVMRRNFQLKYLKQQYNSVKLYMSWLKPYLKHIKRLGMDTSKLDTAELISGMEQAMMEMEILVKLEPEKYSDESTSNYAPYLSLNFVFRTAPEMAFQTKDYQHRGPIHVGRTEVTFKAYSWTAKDYELFKKEQEKEDIALFGTIDSALQDAMDAVGDDLKGYLSELDGEKKKEMKKIKRKGVNKLLAKAFGLPDEEEVGAKPEEEGEKISAKSIFDPFIAVFRGMFDIIDAVTGIKSKVGKAESRPDEWKMNRENGNATKKARTYMWLTYNIFKKAHGMITW